jgi:Protein of unknown function (DUF3298)
MKNYLILLLSVLSLGLLAQELPDTAFYKHMQGSINRNIMVTLNLTKMKDSLSGNYFTQVPEHDGLDRSTRSYQWMQLSGKMTSPTEFILYVQDKSNKRFEGIFTDGNKMEGIFIDEEMDKSFDFKLFERPSKGSIPFNARLTEKSENLNSDSLSPQAKIELFLLTPCNFANVDVVDSIRKTIYSFFSKKINTNSSPDEALEITTKNFFDQYRESNLDLHKNGHSFSWERMTFCQILLNENFYLSLGMINYAFTGGAHGLQINKYYVFDLKDGKTYKLDDFFIPNYQDQLQALLNNEARKKFDVAENQKLSDVGFFMDSIPTSDNFFLVRNGVHFYYNQYQLAPYSWGQIDLFLSFGQLKGIIDQDKGLSGILKN